MLVLIRLTKEHIISTKNNDRTNITIIIIAIVHSIYSQSVHAPALNTGLMDNDAERYCNMLFYAKLCVLCPKFYFCYLNSGGRVVTRSPGSHLDTRLSLHSTITFIY